MDNRSDHIPEDLEIVSVGALFAGPSDKKYWSSSRGKDRHPYPVGYHALRTYGGITYSMEIKEGVKGPLFVVTAPCGDSFSGRTPDVAWGFFWKKNGPKVRIWNGKRFCGKIDGIEFFGFRNPVVQKLLRELVANVREVTNASRISLENEVPDSEMCEPADLLVYLGKRHGTKKRSKTRDKRSFNTCQLMSQDPLHNQKQEGELSVGIETSGQHTCQKSQVNFVPQKTDLSSESICNDPGDVDSAVPNKQLDGFSDSEMRTRESPESVSKHDQIKTNLDIPDSVDIFQDEVDAVELMKRSAQITGCYLDMPKSMMALLLPSAVPLLAKTYKKRRKEGRFENTLASKDVTTSGEISNHSSLTASGEQITGSNNSGGAQIIVPDSLDDDLHVNDVDGQKPLSVVNDSYPKNRDEDGTMDIRPDCSSPQDQSLDDYSSSMELQRNSEANCMQKSGNIHESDHSKITNNQRFPLDLEGIPAVVQESLYASQQEIDTIKENSGSDKMGADISNDSAGARDISNQLFASITKDPCLIAKTSNLMLLNDPHRTCNITKEEPSFKVPFSEIIVLRDSMVPPTNISLEEQSDDQTLALLQNPKEKPDKIDSDLIESTFYECVKSDEKSEESAQLIGCYLHPFSVLSVQIRVNKDKIYICTVCGSPEEVDGFIFLYHTPLITSPSCPSFLGYTSITISSIENADDRRIPAKILGFQLTPDGEHLIFPNYVKVPFCREKNTKCSCIDCKSDVLTSVNTIKIVHLEIGFASTVAELKTAQKIYVFLVCEANLLGIEEIGSFHIWQMESSWRSAHEEFILPGFEFTIPSSSELKHIPKCDTLILGHNGAGNFCLWDISTRVLVSKFCAPAKQVSSFLPLGFFSAQGSIPIGSSLKRWEDSSLLLLVKDESSMALKLSLLVNNSLIFGDILEIRQSSVGALNDLGIIGTAEGNVYMWELTSGRKLGELHPFTGEGGISLIVTDEKSGAFAMVGDGGELRIYRLSNFTG